MSGDWFTAAELAELKLSGLSGAKRKINALADEGNWAVACGPNGEPLARRRVGRGGGYEYHVSLLPAAARADLARRGHEVEPAADGGQPGDADSGLWHWFAQQSDAVKGEAKRRVAILDRVDAFVDAGMSASTAVLAVAEAEAVASSTIWNWRKLAHGVTAADRLPALAPRRQGGGRELEIDAELWRELLSDYLRLSQPRWSECCRRIETIAKARGLAVPHWRTLWRKFEREVPAPVVILRRKGDEALRRAMPAQTRSVADLHAMELVNIDGHTCDVFVNWGNDPKGNPIIARPTLIAIQDVYSRKFLAWRIARSEDMVTARMVFADLFRSWGIPKGLLADNGRAFASKWLTGGAATRFRFKVREEDPVGLLTALGINIHWAKPYRGQSKPIERGFRDLASAIAKHPAFEGAYTGNNPLAKPDNYASRAVDLDAFLAVWNAGMEAHNNQANRRSEMARGALSFDQVFAASYAIAPIGKATDEQLRMALLASDQLTADRRTGAIRLGGNSYWSDELIELAGQGVVVRFDPENLTLPLHVHDKQGRFLCMAPLHEATGFLDMAAAKERQRKERRWKKAAKEAAHALDLLSAAELVQRLPDHDTPEPTPRPRVVRAIQTRGNAAVAITETPDPSASGPQPRAQDTSIDRIARIAATHLRAVD
ncbi:MAG: Mu transposase C-terminal domain-containing protein [Thermomonas sp.]|uniref:transposase domain-containing protein n=1 Tax=Thermomonas sp. TaxID=1971895 RepID=UPI00262B4D12|nr:transposase domain-containing protein [Thermomonas sp.]MCC7097305.1 Mu transposase C-terminal domain-containing protein [Thermomonas sp.]